MRELANDRSGFGVDDEEPHEPQAVLRSAGVLREEEIAREGGNRCDCLILDDQ